MRQWRGIGAVMDLLHAAQLQMHIWQASSRLGSPDDAERVQAMQALEEAGTAAIPRLRKLTKASFARTQFAAAVVLQRLGDPEGMATLLEALKYRLPIDPELAAELEAAYIAIGVPDAVTELIRLWGSIPDWSENQQALTLICRVWATLRDPRAIEELIPRAQRIPHLFVETIPAFGLMAIPALERMVTERDPQRRILAIGALGGIPGVPSFRILEKLLRDPDPEVRSAVPAALMTSSGPQQTRTALIESVQEEYSSRASVEMLSRLGPAPYETLLELVSRWNPQTLTPKGDTGGAVLAALSLLTQAPWPNTRLIPPLCALLQRKPGSELTARIAHVIGVRSQSGTAADGQAREALWPLLAHTDAAVREETAQALSRLGEGLGRQLMQLLAESRPTGNFLNRLETLLRGGPEASAVAAQTVQQVSQWVSRMSRETVERLAAPPGTKSASVLHLQDPRLPDLLRRLLGGVLDMLPRISAPAEVEEMLLLTVSTTRALTRIGMPAALPARGELQRALRCIKRNVVYEGNATGPFQRSDVREIGSMVRLAAAEALTELYGAESFPLLLEALYSPHWECAETAILMLGRLGDVRALPHIQRFATTASAAQADSKNPSLMLAASQAIAAIKRTNPEMMELLRASSATDSRPDTLLRPASGGPSDTTPETLLRPSAQNPLPEN